MYLARLSLTKTIAFTLSHELVHFIKKWSPNKYAAFAEFLIDQYAAHGISSANLLKQKMLELKTTDVEFAYEEMIADACETMLLDSNATVKLMELRKSDLELFEKIKLHVLKILNNIREAYKSLGYKPTSAEANALLGMKDVIEKFYSMFEEAAVDATQNYQALGTEGYNEFVAKVAKNTNETEASKEMGEQRYKRQAKRDVYASGLHREAVTIDDVKAIRDITDKRGKISINKLTSDELKILQKWAYKYWNDLNIRTKSPFFRAWFGEWRAHDTKNKTIISFTPSYSKERVTKNRGDVTIKDVGWTVTISGHGERNTNAHSGNEKKSLHGLTNIRELLENSILFDTELHEHHNNNAPNELIAFDHKLYSLGIDKEGVVSLYKITVEEYYQDWKHPDSKRFHNLRYVEKIAEIPTKKVAENLEGRQDFDESRAVSFSENPATKYSISDLYHLVKYYDKEFTVADEVSPTSINEDGTPRMFDYTTEDGSSIKVFKNGAGQIKSAETGRDANIGTFDGNNDNIHYQKKKTSNREILANALDTMVQNDIERKKLEQYKKNIALMDAEEKKLTDLNAKIKELSFAKGARDTQKIKELKSEAIKTTNRINTYDRTLLNLEGTAALKGVLEREKQKAYKRAEEKGREALDSGIEAKKQTAFAVCFCYALSFKYSRAILYPSNPCPQIVLFATKETYEN